jgi:type II secretory pathway predicted ATPase ExeA
MYAEHWGIRKSPFHTLPEAEQLFASASQEEALARLHFLVENGHRLGLVSGGPGWGKTLLLSAFAAQVRTSGVEVISVPVADCSEQEFLWELATALGTNPPLTTARFALWRRVLDRLDQLAALDKRLVWLVDDAHRAESEVLKLVNRLVRRSGPAPLPLTLVLTLQSGTQAVLGDSMADLIDLHVELEPWTAEEVTQYLQESLAREGVAGSPFAAEAAQRIHALSGGVPRKVNRMAELALLAGAGLQMEQLDGQAINAVVEELDPSFS